MNFGTFENIVYRNADDSLFREYQAIVLQGRYRVRGNLNVQAHYTAQIRNHGNFEGEAANQPGIPSLFADYPEVFDASRNFPEGRLAQFQRHKIRLWAIYNFDMGRFGGLDLSGVWRYNSGLTYSLVEPLRHSGAEVTGLDDLTALAEYRNGGLLVDTGVLVPRRPFDPSVEHPVGSPFVVEWRALTVALIDRLAAEVRSRLGRLDLTLGQVLEGGTWRAGREMAARLRPDGLPGVCRRRRYRADGRTLPPPAGDLTHKERTHEPRLARGQLEAVQRAGPRALGPADRR